MSNGYGVPAPQQQNPFGGMYPYGYGQSSLILDEARFDTNRLLDELEHYLLGETKRTDNKGYVTWEKTGIPLLNSLGAKTIRTIFSVVINPNTLFSYLEKHQIIPMARIMGFKVSNTLYMKGEEFELDPAMHEVIVNALEDFYFITLNRALKGGERKALAMILEERKIITETANQNKGWKLFGGIGKKEEE